MESQKYAIVDLETTGHSSVQGDRIIQIAIVIMSNWQIENTYTAFVNPKKPIPMFIQDLTHISNQDVQHAEPFEAIAQHVYDQLENCIFVAHNTDFDLPFLQAEFKRCHLPEWYGKTIDTVELAKVLFPQALSFKLQDIAFELGIELQQAHRADDDALATAYLLKKCWEKVLTLPLAMIEQLHRRSFKLKSNVSQLLFDAIQLKRTKKERHTWVTYRGLTLKEQKPLRTENVQQHCAYPQTFAQKEALFTSVLTNFEVREGQFHMMDTVWSALQKGEEVMAEASTGIGKTLAYLIPAMLYAANEGKQVVFSTYTSHLLDQLVDEELTKAEEIVQMKLPFAVLKGMEHYIDLDRFYELEQVTQDSYDENFTKMQMIVWLAETETGDLNEVNVSGGGGLFIDKIRRTKTTKETHQKGAYDFYIEAMKKCNKASLVITNHAMLLADLQREEPVLKNLDGLIIDEGHQMIQAATIRDEKMFTYRKWKYIFNQLGSIDERQLMHGFYVMLQKSDKVPLRLIRALESSYRNLLKNFEVAIDYLLKLMNLPHQTRFSSKKTFMLQDLSLDYTIFEKVSNSIQSWTVIAQKVVDTFEKYPDELTVTDHAYVSDWHYWIRELTIKNAEWDQIFLQTTDEMSGWIEVDARSLPGSLHIYKKPLRVDMTVMKVLESIRYKAGIIWTSGTFTVPENKRFIANQLGLEKTVPMYQFQAPLSYYAGAQVYVVDDMPDIQKVRQFEYIEAVAEAVVQTVLATEGRCFVLFTSQDMLRKTVQLIQETEALDDYMIFAQGISSGSRMRLLKMFQKFERSVLFGTNSFWEGVDVPGDALSAVIVVRLPFSSPDEPLFKARADLLQARGQNSFYQLSLPEAILRFKQGFGRLVRTSKDKGAFIILDRRIETKSYGEQFIEALPKINVKKVGLADMVFDLEDWYNNKSDENS